MRAILLALALAACGDFGTPLAAGAVPVHTEADLIACARVPTAYCQIVDARVLKITTELRPVDRVTIDCNRRGLVIANPIGIYIIGSKGVTVTGCHFAPQPIAKCLGAKADADLLGCPVGILARGAASYRSTRNTFRGPGFDKEEVGWRYPGDTGEPSAELDHNRYFANWYGVLFGADEHQTGAWLATGPHGHVSFHNNYSSGIFKRVLRATARYTADVRLNLIQGWGGTTGCDSSQLPPAGWGFALSARGGATMTVTTNLFLPAVCKDPLDDLKTSLDLPTSWGPGTIVASGNGGANLPAKLTILGGQPTMTWAVPTPTPAAVDTIEADIHANAGAPP